MDVLQRKRYEPTSIPGKISMGVAVFLFLCNTCINSKVHSAQMEKFVEFSFRDNALLVYQNKNGLPKLCQNGPNTMSVFIQKWVD